MIIIDYHQLSSQCLKVPVFFNIIANIWIQTCKMLLNRCELEYLDFDLVDPNRWKTSNSQYHYLLFLLFDYCLLVSFVSFSSSICFCRYLWVSLSSFSLSSLVQATSLTTHSSITSKFQTRILSCPLHILTGLTCSISTKNSGTSLFLSIYSSQFLLFNDTVKDKVFYGKTLGTTVNFSFRIHRPLPSNSQLG